MKEYELIHNSAENQFEFHINGEVPVLVYIPVTDKIWVLSHTGVPEDLQGQGVGDALVRESLDAIKDEGKKIVPSCPFVQAYIERHPQYESMVVSAY